MRLIAIISGKGTVLQQQWDGEKGKETSSERLKHTFLKELLTDWPTTGLISFLQRRIRVQPCYHAVCVWVREREREKHIPLIHNQHWENVVSRSVPTGRLTFDNWAASNIFHHMGTSSWSAAFWKHLVSGVWKHWHGGNEGRLWKRDVGLMECVT